MLVMAKIKKASPYDRIWGIGFTGSQAKANRENWGENLLGKALMRVRTRLQGENAEASSETKA